MVDELLHHGYVRAQMDSDETSIFVLAAALLLMVAWGCAAVVIFESTESPAIEEQEFLRPSSQIVEPRLPTFV
jgi:hypothetical protein